MNSLGRISLLCGALILLVFGVVCLKEQMDTSQAPPITPADLASGQPESIGPNPTIVSAKPSTDIYSNLGSSPQELSPAQLSGGRLEPFDGPDINELRVTETNPAAVSGLEFESAIPNSQEPTPPVSSAVLLAPAEIDPAPTAKKLTAPMPTSVVTVPEDSLWKIAERIYGRGDYYKALYLLNRALLSRPDRIPEGIEIATPSIDELNRLYPEATPSSAGPPGSN